MITSVQFKVIRGTGILSRVAIILINSGYRIKKQTLSTLEGEAYSFIKMILESDGLISQRDLDRVVIEIPEILSGECLRESRERSRTDAKNAVVNEDLLKGYFEHLLGNYPDISDSIRKIDADLEVNVRDEILAKLGRALGRKEYKSKYSLGALFGLEKSIARTLFPSLKTFFGVQLEGHEIKIKDCPLCENRIATRPDCVFISGYIQGFLGSISNLPKISVIQTHSAGMGHSNCIFIVHQELA